MPLFSEHIANMYYGSSSPYTGSPYSYSSSVSPIGSSYSASYLNPGGNYSNHSSLSGYSRAPLSSRWITSSGRNYSPMLSTITERGSASPIRINSPRRLPLSTRTYHTSSYTPRPVNINTADIDVSRDKYRHKVDPPKPSHPPPASVPENANDENNSPFMPRADGQEESMVGTSSEVKRGTIQRGRTVVRLYTVKRKERDSPRKPIENQQSSTDTEKVEVVPNDDSKIDEKEFMKWREKLSEDLAYKEKREKKTLGAKLVEKFIVRNDSDKQIEIKPKEDKNELDDIEKLPTTSVNNCPLNMCLDRRRSMELMAEQANLLDSLIRSENLSTATLELNKVGLVENKTNLETFESLKRRRPDNLHNPLKTTKSDHSLHDSLKSQKDFRDIRDAKSFSKRRSLKKSSSGSSIRRLDSITEFPKESNNVNLPAIEERTISNSLENSEEKPKPKLKTKVTGSVEISEPKSPLKFIVENVTVEEKVHTPKKEIIYSSEVEEIRIGTPKRVEKSNVVEVAKNRGINEKELPSPEPENGNFWDKIGKRETVYLMKRKQNMDEAREKNKRALFWFPETEEEENAEQEQKEDSVDKHKENNISDKKIIEKASDERLKENTFDEKSDKLSQDIHILHHQISEKNTDINTERIKTNDEISTLPGIDKDKEISTKSLETVHDKLDLTLVESSKEKPNKVKSASLEKVKENQSNERSIKKTKSEKAKKALKITNMCEAKQLEVPSTNNSTEKILNLNDKIQNSAEGCDKFKTTCPIHPNTVLKVKEEKSLSDKIKKPCPVHPDGPNTVKTDVEENDSSKRNPPQSMTSANSQENTLISVKTTDETEKVATGALPTKENTMEKGKIAEIIDIIDNKSNSVSTVKDADKCIEQVGEIPKLSKTENQIISTPKITEKEKLSKCEEENVNIQEHITVSEVINLNNDATIVRTQLDNNLENDAVNKEVDSQKNSSQAIPEKVLSGTDYSSDINQPSTSSFECAVIQETKTTVSNNDVPEVAITLSDIPIKNSASEGEEIVQTEKKTSEENKAEDNITPKGDKIVEPELPGTSPIPTATPKKVVKEEKALRPLIATPRPLQKKAPQIIHSSDSSDSSSEDESSEDEDESDSSEGSGEFFECENNPDGRTSTGSNDSGFDSSAPASPATFSQIKKDCDVNCHRKCEKLTANLCGVNQRLLVEALATRTASKKGGDITATPSSSSPAQSNNSNILEQQLEQSTAYDIYRKTGRFTPPARSIPRFRKYTVEDFQFIKVLGKGSFGKVLLAELRDTEYYYAVKCLKKDVVLEDDDVECTLIERKVLALGTNHPYLCHLFATFQTDSHLFFVMEYLNGGDLMFHIQQSGRFPEARGRFYAAEIVSGLKFLHKRGIVYRDLKLDNILLDYEGHVRIADFGMCKLQIYLDKTADTFCGTPDYMAPEIIKGLKYNQTVDWWSFGVLLYEMLIGQSPFSGCDEDELFWSICNEMPSYPRFLSREALTILTRLLDKDARTRLGGTECMHGDIREQEFFHPIHWDRLERRELEAPFRPRVRHPMDTQYFDKAFTGERPRLTAVEPQVLRSMDQEPFRGFSYTNPNTTDR